MTLQNVCVSFLGLFCNIVRLSRSSFRQSCERLNASVTRQYAVILVVTEKVTKVNWRCLLPPATV